MAIRPVSSWYYNVACFAACLVVFTVLAVFFLLASRARQDSQRARLAQENANRAEEEASAERSAKALAEKNAQALQMKLEHQFEESQKSAALLEKAVAEERFMRLRENALLELHRRVDESRNAALREKAATEERNRMAEESRLREKSLSDERDRLNQELQSTRLREQKAVESRNRLAQEKAQAEAQQRNVEAQRNLAAKEQRYDQDERERIKAKGLAQNQPFDVPPHRHTWSFRNETGLQMAVVAQSASLGQCQSRLDQGIQWNVDAPDSSLSIVFFDPAICNSRRIAIPASNWSDQDIYTFHRTNTGGIALSLE